MDLKCPLIITPKWHHNDKMNQNTSGYDRYGNFIINRSECLGSGNYGQVYKGYLIGNQKQLEPVAIKESPNETHNIHEVQTLQILKHPNIIRYIDYKVSGNSIFLVMELCEGGTLDDLLFGMQNHQPEKLIHYYSQIVRGIKFMYDKKILHRDMKPSNLLVKKNVIKIADFGTSKVQASHELRTLVGTPLFFSPELFEVSFGDEDKYTEKSQIWSLGLILYYMFNYDRNHAKGAQRMKSSLPWSGKNALSLFNNIKSKKLQFKNSHIPSEIKSIICRMLEKDVEHRMGFPEFLQLKIFHTQELSLLPESFKLEERTINPINRETIDWELQQLLSLKNQQNLIEEEMEEYRQFYEMLVEQLSHVCDCRDSELMFELDRHYYCATSIPEDRQKILQKYPQRKSLFNGCEQTASMGSSPSDPVLDQRLMALPGQKLIEECKKFIKANLKKISDVSGLKFESRGEEFQNLIFTIYDFLTLLTLEKSWEIKRKSKLTIAQYRRSRRAVPLGKLVSRVRKALEVVPV